MRFLAIGVGAAVIGAALWLLLSPRAAPSDITELARLYFDALKAGDVEKCAAAWPTASDTQWAADQIEAMGGEEWRRAQKHIEQNGGIEGLARKAEKDNRNHFAETLAATQLHINWNEAQFAGLHQDARVKTQPPFSSARVLFWVEADGKRHLFRVLGCSRVDRGWVSGAGVISDAHRFGPPPVAADEISRIEGEHPASEPKPEEETADSLERTPQPKETRAQVEKEALRKCRSVVAALRTGDVDRMKDLLAGAKDIEAGLALMEPKARKRAEKTYERLGGLEAAAKQMRERTATLLKLTREVAADQFDWKDVKPGSEAIQVGADWNIRDGVWLVRASALVNAKGTPYLFRWEFTKGDRLLLKSPPEFVGRRGNPED